MTFDKFTIKAQEAIQSALDTAKRNGQQTIEPVHILAGVMDKGKDVTDYVLQKLGVNAQTVELSLQNEIKHLPKVSGGEPYFSPDSNKVLEKTLDISQKLGDDYVSIEPLLLALLQVGSTASRILKDAGCTEKEMLQAIQSLRQGQKVESQSGDENFQALSKYATNLVERARAGKLDPVIGRDEEIRRVLQILSRRTKNNPILIGEPGTGKTAIVEGLATSSSSSTRSTRSWEPVVARAPWTPPTSSSRPWHVANCVPSVRRRSTSIRSTLRRTRPWSAASRPSWSRSRTRPTPSPSYVD